MVDLIRSCLHSEGKNHQKVPGNVCVCFYAWFDGSIGVFISLMLYRCIVMVQNILGLRIGGVSVGDDFFICSRSSVHGRSK